MKADIPAHTAINKADLEECLERAIKDIITTMFDFESEIIPFEDMELFPPGLSAIIGFGGKISGNIAIHLSPDNACTLASNMLGMEFKALDDIVADAMGEMVNMLAGGVKKYASRNEDLFKISVPSIIYGSDYSTHVPNNSERITTGIKAGTSTFHIQLNFTQS